MKPTHKNTQQITIKMDQVEPSGDCSGIHNKIKFFVRDTIPGETIVAEVTALSQQRPEGFASLYSIEEGSPARVPVACAHVETCGGCDWQHIKADSQLQYKQQLIQSALSQHQSLASSNIEPCQPSPESYQYRYVAKWVSKMHLGKVWLGAFARRTHDIVSTQGCAVHRAPLEDLGETIRTLLNQPIGNPIALYLRYVVARESFHTGELALVLIGWKKPSGLDAFIHALLEAIKLRPQLTLSSISLHINERQGDSLFDHKAPTETLFGESGVPEEIAGQKARIPVQAFLQINPAQARRMQQEAILMAALKDEEASIIELYAGVSELSLLLAKQLPKSKISSIERSTQSVEVAKQLKQELSLLNLSVYQGDSVELFTKHPTSDVIFLNPPRAGASPEVISAILRAAPKKIIYTSCSPKTFARDAALLVQGGYKIQRVVPFDLFPQTAHVEIVALFSSI